LHDSILTGNAIDDVKSMIAKLTDFLASLTDAIKNTNREDKG
jgi:hypothetical protein